VAIALPGLLAGCVHAQRPGPAADRIESWFVKTKGHACGVIRYKHDWHSDRGEIFIKTRNGGGPDPIPLDSYTVRCASGGVYWVEIPENPELNASIMYCVNGVRAFRSGCRMW
jgi:hypothetical protein